MHNWTYYFHRLKNHSKGYIQCFGSGSGWIRIIWPGPDPDQLQETLIWIRVAKNNSGKLGYNSTKIKEYKKKNSLITKKKIQNNNATELDPDPD